MEILTLNKIAACGTDLFDEKYTVADNVQNPDGILVRSAAMHDMELPESLLAIARAGAGVNNIPIDKCAEKGIVVFNTPGANANAVKELVLAGLLLASRQIVPAIEWAKTLKGKGDEVGKLVEKGKSQFVGPELKGKKLGVIGLGAIGGMVANTAQELGMEVYGFDPYLSVEAAWSLSRGIHHATSYDEIYKECDYITIHVPLNDGTKGFINKETISQMKDGVRILNFARGGLVNSQDMLDALKEGKVARYVIDFPSDEMLDVENVVAIPHLGASTPESEDNCAVMASEELIDYLENGNIRHSVNYPDCVTPRITPYRVVILHKNVPSTIAQITTVFGSNQNNIEGMVNKSRKEYAYTVVDLVNNPNPEGLETIRNSEGIIRVRVIK
ncbi:MAG: 3-phosphoglycerate dehydrogenase [Clostridia bacterium]|nr:3-phosphoglycerate dehydrogenase [Clostridia bacterium]